MDALRSPPFRERRKAPTPLPNEASVSMNTRGGNFFGDVDMNSVRILRENFFMLQCGKNYWSMYCVPQFSGVRRRREKNLEPQKIDGLSSIDLLRRVVLATK